MDQNEYFVSTPEQEESYGELDLMKYFRKVLSAWKIILAWCIVAAFVGYVVNFCKVKTYTVSAKLAPESSAGSSGGGALGSLASLAGINLGGSTSGDAFSPSLYPEIVSSAPFLTDLFNVPVEFERHGEKYSITYFEYLAGYQKKWRFSSGLPKNEVKVKPVAISDLSIAQVSVLDKMKKRVNLKADSKSRVLELAVMDQNPMIANQIAQVVIANLKSYITGYRTQKSRNDLEYYEKLYSEAEAEYFDAQQRYARYMDMNQGMIRQSVKIEEERLRNETNLKYQVYNSCAQQVQIAKAQVQRETPVFVVIEPSTTPFLPNEKSMKSMVIFAALGFMLSILWVLWGSDLMSRFFAKSKNRN